MRKKHLLLLLFILLFKSIYAQDALVMLKFEEAEKAFNSGNYNQVLKHLDEVEKKAGVTSKTLYLRIIAEDKLFDDGAQLFVSENELDRLFRLRKNAKAYLDALSQQGLDDKYRKIYRISENLKEFPQNKKDWITKKDNYFKRIKDEKLKQVQAEKVAAKRLKDQEYDKLYNNSLSINNAKHHLISQIKRDASSTQTATVYFIRPDEGTKNMPQSLLINEEVVEDKFKPGEYVKLYFSPGLIKVGETSAENKRKVKTGNAILMGGIIGLAATSGKIVAKNQSPFFLEVLAGQTYYISSVITDDKTIKYTMMDEKKAQSYISATQNLK